MEGGFFEKLFYDLKTTKFFKDGTQKTYTSLEEYIKDHTYFESIKLNNFYYLFILFFGFNFCVFAFFVCFHVFNLIPNTFKLVNEFVKLLKNCKKMGKKLIFKKNKICKRSTR